MVNEQVPADTQLSKAWEELSALVEFAYEQGFHELGYNPLNVVDSALAEAKRSLRREENAREIAVKDADRYRWIRRQKHTHIAACWIVPAAIEVAPGPEAFDKAIDAAMEQQS